MRPKRFTEEQITIALRQAEAGTHGVTIYRITVEHLEGVYRGVSQVRLDGTPLSADALVPLSDDGGEHLVEVVLG